MEEPKDEMWLWVVLAIVFSIALATNGIVQLKDYDYYREDKINYVNDYKDGDGIYVTLKDDYPYDYIYISAWGETHKIRVKPLNWSGNAGQ